MKKFILPIAAGFALGLSGAAMAGNVNSDHGKVAAQDHSIVATVSGPQLMTDTEMDKVVAGDHTAVLLTYYNGGQRCAPDVTAYGATVIGEGSSSYTAADIAPGGC